MVNVYWLTGEIELIDEVVTVEKLKQILRGNRRNISVWIYENQEEKRVIPDSQELQVHDLVYCVITPDTEMIPHDHERVYRHFQQLFGSRFHAIQDALRQCDAVIAGSAVLAAFANFVAGSISLYAHQHRARKLVEHLAQVGFQSHMITLNFEEKNLLFCVCMVDTAGTPTLPLKVYVVANDVHPLTNICDFDLSFCDTWWDGRNVYCTDPESVRSQRGHLKLKSLFKVCGLLDMTLISCVQKYKTRGFHIQLYEDSSLTLEDIETYFQPRSTIETWNVRRAMSTIYFIISEAQPHTNFLEFCFRFWPEELTYDSLKKIFPSEIIDKITQSTEDIDKLTKDELCAFCFLEEL